MQCFSAKLNLFIYKKTTFKILKNTLKRQHSEVRMHVSFLYYLRKKQFQQQQKKYLQFEIEEYLQDFYFVIRFG